MKSTGALCHCPQGRVVDAVTSLVFHLTMSMECMLDYGSDATMFHWIRLRRVMVAIA